ncbi:42022_t:CDS:2 [Gigaspora margarita]|uniref:42022_t:CDS:1 n=1 Tax=Gigaspora margarita TaxID=4874 RepID=A0ABN7UPB3_GIGMA|nr:42022_t:CDS:2 [Gigaspora margarita]
MSPYTLPRLFDLSELALVKVVPHSLVITAFSVLIVALWEYTNIKLGIKSDFILVITFVVSFLLAYRTNAAYTRYWERRQLWSTMITSIRNLIRYVWANAPEINQINKNNEKEIDSEKYVVFCLLTEFAAATKKYLRSFNKCSGVPSNMESSDNNEDENNDSIIIEDLKWATVPVVFLSSLLLLGVEAIAREIEDLFGTDLNNLKIDDFCNTLDTEQDFVKNHKYMGDQWQKAIDKILNFPEITAKLLKQVTVDITEDIENTKNTEM